MKKRSFLLIYILVSLSSIAYPQAGPGGVGDNSTNIFWLDANRITGFADGANLDTWEDFSGNGLDLTQPNVDFTPEYRTNIVNGNPVVRFNKTIGTGGRLRRLNVGAFPTAEITQFIVNRNNGENNDALTSYASSSHNNDFLIFNSSNIRVYRRIQYNTGVASNDNNWHIINPCWRVSDRQTQIWLDGTLRSTGTTPGPVGQSITANGCFAVAGEQDVIDGNYVLSQAHLGDFAEVLVYNFKLNTAQRIIVNNYLSAKYNIPQPGNDVYNEDDAANGNFDFEVAGIGRVNVSDLHNDAQGSGVVRISSPTDLDDDEFLMWGHDNAVLEGNEMIDVPISVQARFERVWRASEASVAGTAVDVGAVNIRFDLSGLGPVTASDLRLLVDTDNDGNFADETIGTGGLISGAILVGGYYQFAGVTAIENNRRFTLGTINMTQTPLPIELIDFSAFIDNTYVKINWQTASEINNDYFTIERSIDALEWNEIETIDGAGNSSDILAYSAFDDNPLAGKVYYRLKQTDFDGTSSYSQVEMVNTEGGFRPDLKLYPNPAYDQLTIVGNNDELESIRVFNVQGQNVTTTTRILSKTDSSVVLDISELAAGVYYFKTKNTTSKVVKK